jgi:hypothetical protein
MVGQLFPLEVAAGAKGAAPAGLGLASHGLQQLTVRDRLGQLLQVGTQESLELRPRKRPYFLCGHCAVLEQEQCWNAPDAELSRRGRIVVDIELGDTNLVLVEVGRLFENRRNRFAGATPFGPEIEQHGLS